MNHDRRFRDRSGPKRCPKWLPKVLCDLEYGNSNVLGDEPQKAREPDAEPEAEKARETEAGLEAEPEAKAAFRPTGEPKLKYVYDGKLRTSVPMDIQTDAIHIQHLYDTGAEYKRLIKTGLEKMGDNTIRFKDLDEFPPNVETRVRNKVLPDNEAYLDGVYDDLAQFKANLTGQETMPVLQWEPERSISTVGFFEPETKRGKLFLGGAGSSRDKKLDQTLSKLVARNRYEEAESLYRATDEFRHLKDLVREQAENGVTDLELVGHSLAGWKARASVNALADEFPDVAFRGKGLNAHTGSRAPNDPLKPNAAYEYHTIADDGTNLKTRVFSRAEKANGADQFYYLPKREKAPPFYRVQDRAFHQHYVDKFFDANQDLVPTVNNEPLDRRLPIRVNADGKLENFKGALEEGAIGIGGGIIGELATAPLDPYLDADARKRQAEHTAISAPLSGIGTGVVKGGVNVAKQAFAAEGLAGTGAAFASGFADAFAPTAAGVLVGGLTDQGVSYGVQKGLQAAGASDDASEATGTILGSTAGGAAGTAATIGAASLYGAELGEIGGPVGIAIGAGIGATVGGVQEIIKHRKDIGNFFRHLF